jgi:two-component system, OmpR family, response regulator
MRIALAEDDELLGKALRQGLCEAGHDCQWYKNGLAVLDAVRGTPPDAVVLDLMLPDMHGLAVLASLRADGLQTPVLVLTALGSIDERVTGLRAGADDYLVKPFAFAELMARLDAITRRAGPDPIRTLRSGPLSLDFSTRRVVRDGREIELTPTEFSLLEFLMRHADQVVTRRMLCEHLWHADWEGVTNVIEVHINRLRGKIDRDFPVALLHTVRGRGYSLKSKS